MNPREEIVEICHLMYTRKLADTFGGSISVLKDKKMYMTPRNLGSRYHWNIDVNHLQVWDWPGESKSPERLPHEAELHLEIYRRIPTIGAVIRAYPQYATVFAASNKAIPPVLDAMEERYGDIPLAEPAPLHSLESIDNALRQLESQASDLEEHALAVLQPRQGLIVAGLDLNQAFVGLERIDSNARCILLGNLARIGGHQ
jgi:ribulose-5-phosphate 4-epimerase/fuculose-1-phosphate aldolase